MAPMHNINLNSTTNNDTKPKTKTQVDRSVRGFNFSPPLRMITEAAAAQPPPAVVVVAGGGSEDLGLFHIYLGRPRLESAF